MLLRILVLLCAVGCTKRNPASCCENQSECEALGTNEIVTCPVGVCVDFVCVDPGPCDGNEDCTLPDTCVEGQCTAPAPPIDAPPVRAFDVAYPNEWRFSVAGPVPVSLVVISTGNSPVNMSTLQLKSIDDDHPTAFVRMIATPSTADIGPGFAGGFIATMAEPLLLGSGLVTEPRVDTNSDYLSLELVDAPVGTYDIKVDVVIALDGVDAPLAMTIHVVPGPTIFVDPEAATRASVFR